MRPLSLVAACALALPAFAQEPGKDALGDPLPEGAVARLGTERLRQFDMANGESEVCPIVHPDGKRVFGTIQGRLGVVDIASGRSLGRGKQPVVKAVTALAPDGNRGISVSERGLKVWEIESGRVVLDEPFFSPLVSPDEASVSHDGGVVAAGGWMNSGKATGVVRVYDVAEKREGKELKVMHNRQAWVRLSADGRRAVTWGTFSQPGRKKGDPEDPDELSKRVQMWDVLTGKESAVVRLPGDYLVASAAISPDGRTVAASAGDGAVCLFDATTGKRIRELLGREEVGFRLTFSPDGKRLTAAAADGAVQTWEVASGKRVGVTAPPVMGAPVTVTAITYTGSESAVATAVIGRAVAVWDVTTGKLLGSLSGHLDRVTAVSFSADGKEVVTGGFLDEVFRWQQGGKLVQRTPLRVPGRAAGPTRTPPPDNPLCSCGATGFLRGTFHDRVEVWRESGELNFSMLTPRTAIHAQASADGRVVAFIQFPESGAKIAHSRLSVLNAEKGERVGDIELGALDVKALALSADGKRAAVTLREPGVDGCRMWITAVELPGGKGYGRAELDKSFAPANQHMTLAPDGKTVLTAARGQKSSGLQEYNLTTGEGGERFGALGLEVTTPATFSPDGKRVAVAYFTGSEARIQVFDWATREERLDFRGHSERVSCLAFSPDGKTLASGSLDTTVLLWDVSKEK